MDEIRDYTITDVTAFSVMTFSAKSSLSLFSTGMRFVLLLPGSQCASVCTRNKDDSLDNSGIHWSLALDCDS
jgi:hypothetical protein